MFLYFVLCGVRTGCPLSATLFLLCMNPFLELINWLADGPKLARTCVCADDIGSSLRQLMDLKILHGIFQLAARTSGMFLKPAKCFLAVTAVDLNTDVVHAIKQWLLVNIPDWADFQIVAAGKYLGVWLGKDGDTRTWAIPSEKYLERSAEIAVGQAPALPSIIRYNQRAVSVFAYILQVFPVPENLASLEQRCVHKMLKLPPNCMSRKLMHSFHDFCDVIPTSVISWCRAAMYRFAFSNCAFLLKLRSEVVSIVGDNISVLDFCGSGMPHGGKSHPPLLESLCNALTLSGDHVTYMNAVHHSGMRSWFHRNASLAQSTSSHPDNLVDDSSPGVVSSIQSKIYRVFCEVERCHDVPQECVTS